MERFTFGSLIPVLEAASVSPTASHRGLSIAELFHTVAQRRHNGRELAGAGHVADLVAGVASSSPRISMLEDSCPLDGRSEVLARWGLGLFRLLPGHLERPTAMVAEQALLAPVIDHVLIPRLGFGLADAGEVILRRVDRVARVLAPHWPAGAAADIGDTPTVTQAEVDAAMALPLLDDVIHECRHPDRAASAAARYTVAGRELGGNLQDPVSTFGAVVATRVHGRVVPLPAAYLMEAFPAIGRELAAMAAAANPHANDVFSEVVGRHVAQLFQGSGNSIRGPIRAGSGRPIHSLITYNGRQILALDLAAGLTPAAIQARLDAGAAALDRIRPGAAIHGHGNMASSHRCEGRPRPGDRRTTPGRTVPREPPRADS